MRPLRFVLGQRLPDEVFRFRRYRLPEHVVEGEILGGLDTLKYFLFVFALVWRSAR